MKVEALKIKDRLWVQYKGRIYSLPTELKSSRAADQSEEEELIAPFSCKVLKLHVRDGQKVKKGDPIVVVEAMKMEYSYSSPRDGEIAETLAKEGSVHQQGAAFVRWKDSK